MLAAALDLGGSHAGCAVVRDTELVARREISVGRESVRQLLGSLEELVTRTVSDAGVALCDCRALVFGFPGIVDSRTGKVIATNAKFDDALELDLPAWSRSAFGLPFVLENDARLALLGEQAAGAARGAQDVVLITLGTGVGAAAMLDGKPLRGRFDQAGCLGGHIPLVLEGRLCTCGNIGCAEAEASSAALPAICSGWRGYADSVLKRSPAPDFECLFAAADAGDRVAEQVLAHCMQVWAALSVALIHAYSPEILVFGGGVMARAHDILPYICDHVSRHAWSPRGPVRIAGAQLGAAAPLIGAIPLLMEIQP